MKKLLYLMLLLFFPPYLCVAGDLQELERKIFSADKPMKYREWLEKLKLLDKWSEKGGDAIELDGGASFGCVSNTYSAKSYDDIIHVTLSWKLDEGVVNQIVLTDKKYYYVYSWEGGRFIQTATLLDRTSKEVEKVKEEKQKEDEIQPEKSKGKIEPQANQ